MPVESVAGPAPLALFAVVVVGLLAGYASLVYWVYRDAAVRGSDSPGRWALAVAVFAPALVVYLYRRTALGAPTEPETRRDRLARVLAAGWFAALLVGAIAAPPDPFTQLSYAGGTMAVAVFAGTILVLDVGPGGEST